VAPSKNNEKKSPIATTLINRFERSCDTLERKKIPIVVNNVGLICLKIYIYMTMGWMLA
jgi:hypothetical protein